MRKWILLLLTLLMLFGSSTAQETGEMLSQDDLVALEPAYSAFLEEFSALLIERGLLTEGEKEAWLLAQLGDFYQNGGYGMIATLYGTDLLTLARPQDQLLRLSKRLPGLGTLHIETMQAYYPLDSTLPGLLLRAELQDADGLPVEARFRWICDQGGYLAWDAFTGTANDVGGTLINDGRTAYWSDQPPFAGQAEQRILRVEVLSMGDDLQVLGEGLLTLSPQAEGWVLSEGALQ